MTSRGLTIERRDWRLQAVPAIHFRVAFAEEVNALCRSESTKPAAIAVELGHDMVMAAAGWMREMGVRPGHRFRLPCMLGLAKPNRRIRASVREKALALQRQSGLELQELPPRVLKEALGYSSLSVLYLSPTDSIIEAIRCALELDIPLYGVDLEESAVAERAEVLIEDPASGRGWLQRYVRRNANYAAAQRDQEVDSRREVAMATRLKTVLERHKQVLFTGGIAHWPNLERMLCDDDLRPGRIGSLAPFTDASQRVVVHPLIAIHHLDVFPAFAESYETLRETADSREWRVTWDRVDVSSKFEQLLSTAYIDHFGERAASDQLDRRMEDLEARRSFEQLMLNLCLLSQRRVPDLFTALSAAEGTMSPTFCEQLAETLMKFPWATPDEFSELPVLAPSPTEPGDSLRAEVLEPGGQRARPGEWIYIHSTTGRSSQHVKVKVPWEWDAIAPPETERDASHLYAWPPTTRLVTAMSIRANRITSSRTRVQIEQFDGTLCDGIDTKATLRAQARGDDKVFVRDSRKQRQKTQTPTDEWDAMIWIFRTGAEGGAWDFMAEPLEELVEEGYAADPFRVLSIAAQKSAMIQQVGYGRRSMPRELPDAYGVPASVRQARSIQFSIDLHGILLYSPPHFHGADNCAFAENTEFRRNPYCTYPALWSAGEFPRPVWEMFLEEYGMDLDLGDWPTTMMRMAIPFAQRSVTVIAPDGFQVSGRVQEEARKRGKIVEVLPHSYLPRETLRRMSIWHGVAALPGTNGKELDPEFERVFGESRNANMNLLPPYWLNYAEVSRKMPASGAAR